MYSQKGRKKTAKILDTILCLNYNILSEKTLESEWKYMKV